MFRSPPRADNDKPGVREMAAFGMAVNDADASRAVETTGANPAIVARLRSGRPTLLGGDTAGDTKSKLGG